MIVAEEKTMEQIQCVIERITYHNEENGFSVIKCQAKGFYDLITAVGSLHEVHVGSVMTLFGCWKVNPKYGRQFSFQKYEESLPATVSGIEKYLGSGLIKGIGPAYAERIVKQFGKNTLKILEKNPDRLSEVPGIGPKRIEQIKESWIEQREIKNVMLFLQSYDVSVNMATKIYKQYGKEAVLRVTENPYRLADEIWGIGFKTADAIASKLGFGHEKYERIRSGILYTLNKFSEEGHCFAYFYELLTKADEILDVGNELLVSALERMIAQKDLICERDKAKNEDAIYLPVYYYAEVGIARRLHRLMDSARSSYIGYAAVNEWQMSDEKMIHYDDTQLQAIQAAVDNKVLVLTGGPGTGKTTTTLGIINVYRASGAKILLAAPTGRAAKRLSEVTGMTAKTIHRMLKMKPLEGFQKNENDPLEGDVLIVDECSMIDCLLMNSLLKAVPSNMTLILVGDIDQLPSVGAGKVLSDILASGVVPSIKLEKIFRQAQRSQIIMNAHRINRGDFPYLTDHDSDFLYVEETDPDKAADTIVRLCAEVLPEQGINKEDIQVLTPMRRGAVGAVNLNQRLQEVLNPDGISMKRGGVDYRVGDKVMQIRNNYAKAVFNGDIGIIEYVDVYNGEMSVIFDDRKVSYDSSDIDELVLAYATTIHKSQGSEFPYVVMPLMKSHFMMLQRNLFYTGVTRAKNTFILVGDKKAIFIAVKNNKIVARNTQLSVKLIES